jgi:hypothetical protein
MEKENEMTNLPPDEMVTLFHEMRSLLEEILAANDHIAAANFRVVYLSTEQMDRVRRAVGAGETFSISLAPPPAETGRSG